MIIQQQKLARHIFSFLLVFSTLGMVSLSFSLYIVVIFIALCFLGFKVSKKLLVFLLPLFGLLFLGSIDAFGNGLYSIMKDVWYLLKIILAISVGYLMMAYIKDFTALCRIIVITGIFSAIYHLVRIVLNIDSISTDALYYLREGLGISGSFLSIIALLILLFCKHRLSFSPIEYTAGVLFCSLSLFLSMSRTFIVVFLVMLLAMIGKEIFRGRVLMLVLFTFTILLMTLFLNSNSTLVSKFENSSSEMTVQDYSKMNDINRNWRGFEAYRALETYLDGSVFEKIIGQGFGTQIDLGFVMSLGGNNMQFIPMTHNAYMYLLVKFGVLGVLIYIFFIYRLIKKKRLYSNCASRSALMLARRLITSIGVMILLTTFVISGVFNLFKLDVVLIILGALFFVVSSHRKVSTSYGQLLN